MKREGNGTLCAGSCQPTVGLVVLEINQNIFGGLQANF
jgi:hypothetical protein